MKNKKKIIRLLILSMMVMVLGAFSASAAAPGKVRVTKVTKGEGKATLKWAKVKGAKNYVIYNQQGAKLKKVAQVKSSKTSYTIKGLKNNKEYTFYVAAKNGSGTGAKSSAVKVVPSVKGPGAVKSPRIVGNASGKVSLRWTSTKNATGYILYQKTEDGEYRQLLQTKKTKVTVKGLTNGRVYTFAVRAFRTVKGATSYGPISTDLIGRPSGDNAAVKKIHSYYYKVKVKTPTTAKGKSGSISLKKGQTITVTAKGSTQSTATINGKSYKVASSALNFDRSSFITDNKKAYSNAEAEAFVNYKGYNSKTPYMIWISTYGQRVYLFTGSQYNWKVVKSFLCSTGMAGKQKKDDGWQNTETVLGVHEIVSKQPRWDFAADQYGFYATVVSGMGGAIHSWLYHESSISDHMTKYPGIGTLGQPASHGCVRVEINNAKYIYQQIPIGSRCVVY